MTRERAGAADAYVWSSSVSWVVRWSPSSNISVGVSGSCSGVQRELDSSSCQRCVCD